jgi:hypothetical protein
LLELSARIGSAGRQLAKRIMALLVEVCGFGHLRRTVFAIKIVGDITIRLQPEERDELRAAGQGW